MPENDDLFSVFGDLLHETPEAEHALREWRKKQAVAAVRKIEKARRQRKLNQALSWFSERRKRSRE